MKLIIFHLTIDHYILMVVIDAKQIEILSITLLQTPIKFDYIVSDVN
jgi:hypothetical protein